MGGIFNLDNSFWRFISRVFDAVMLSFLWIICCIPVVTIGASTTAFYYTLMKISKDEEGYITQEFFKAFKQNFKQSTIIFIFTFIIQIVIILDIFIVLRTVDSLFEVISLYLFFFLFILNVMFTLYVFPLIARFENTTKNLARYAFIMCIKHLGWTVVMLIISGVGFVVGLIVPPLTIILPGLVAFVNATIFNHIFERYIKAIKDKQKEENGEDDA